MRLNSITNGTFGAHNGPGNGFFGARGILCAPEGEGGGGAGGAPAATSEGEKAVTPPPGKGATFTPEQQEEVNRIAARAREDGRKAATKEKPIEKAPASSDEDKPLTMKELAAENAAIKARMSFDKRIAKLGLSDEAADDMFALNQLQKPADQGRVDRVRSRSCS